MTAVAEEARAVDRVEGFDVLRAWAIAGVVLLHTAAPTVAAHVGEPYALVGGTGAAVAYDALGRFAVDCFFMMSGALLLDPRRSFRLAPRLRRVVVPLLAWSLVYVVADVALQASGHALVAGSVTSGDLSHPWRLVGAAVSGPVAYHLWFVYALVAIYLVVPLLRPLTDRPEPERRRLVVGAVALFAVVMLAGFVSMLAPSASVFPLLLPDLPTGVLGIFVLGFALTAYARRTPRAVGLAAAAAGLVWIVVAVWREQDGGGRTLWGLENTWPPVVLFAVGAFLVALRHERRASRWTRRVADLSFRVYLCHVLVLEALSSLPPVARLLGSAPAVGIPLVALTTLALSVVLAAVIERLPVARSAL